MKKLLCSLALAPILLAAADSAFYQEFVRFKEGKGAPGLPDFSYAGYAMGEKAIPPAAGKIFAVTDFGAKPDDGGCDRDGIAKAIAAAEANGGGIVYFPKGRYLVAERDDIFDGFTINCPNIILKGDGSGPGGTEIFMKHHFGTKTPEKMYSTAKLFQFVPPKDRMGAPGLAMIVADAPRESFSITVDRPDNIKPGEIVVLEMRNPAANALFLDNLPTWEIWTDTNQKGVRVMGERHQVDRVAGREVFFKEPIHCDIVASHEWRVRGNVFVSGWGVEDIHFRGNLQDAFKHHLNYILDSGWSMVGIQRGYFPYVRRCRFTDVSNAVSFASSYGPTVLNCAVEGNQGHMSFSFDYFCYGGLGAFCYDKIPGGMFHGFGANAGSVGSVVYRCKNSDRGFDFHASWPYATLIDNCSGGMIGNGGDVVVLPNHMKHLVFWNFEDTGVRSFKEYDFWQPRRGQEKYSNVKIVKPYLIGYRGPTTFLESSCGAVESYGKAVSPRSLYLAQYRLRTGKELPPWHAEAERQLEFYREKGYFEVPEKERCVPQTK